MTAQASDAQVASGWADPRAGEAVEVTFLLLRNHLAALERLADAEGITVGRLLRRIIRDHLTREARFRPSAEGAGTGSSG